MAWRKIVPRWGPQCGHCDVRVCVVQGDVTVGVVTVGVVTVGVVTIGNDGCVQVGAHAVCAV